MKEYKTAIKCHQQRLLGDSLHDPDIWFEYGCFCMRARPKDQGRAEECWREAIALKRSHLFSLQALGCLMWHRGNLVQAEIMLKNAINLHTEEEHVNWVLFSQVYAMQGNEEYANVCLKRAESLYFLKKGSQNAYSLPHQLLSPLWRFPFSLSYQILSNQRTSNLFVDAAMLLLDLHLPKEAEQVLALDIEVYTCTLDNKWCKSRISELNGKLEDAENFMNEALQIDKENPTTWLLLGHLRYNYEIPRPNEDKLQRKLYRGAIEAYHQYKRLLDDDEKYYKFAYLDLGFSFFKLGEWDEARQIFLKGCTKIPTSPMLWLAVGIAYFYAGDFEHAELALVEGNMLDASNFKIWAFLTLICIKTNQIEAAEVSFQESLKCNVDSDLLITIAQEFEAIGNFRDAEIAYLESLKIKEIPRVRLQLAEMCFKEGRLTVAACNYQTVVKAHDCPLLEKDLAMSRLVELAKHDQLASPTNKCLKGLPIEI